MNSKLFKSFPAILLAIVLLGGCGANTSKVAGVQGPTAGKAGYDTATITAANTESNTKTVTIAASFYPMYIMALNVAKDMSDVKVINMTKPMTGCLHDYAVTPDDLRNL